MKHMPTAYVARGPREWFNIETPSNSDGPSKATVKIYEQIGKNWWGEGVGAKDFADQLDELDVDVIELLLNSPGGAAWEGVTIMNTLRRHKARVEVTVDGMAASAASVIAMAGDHITMNRGSQMMIHDAWGLAMGNATDMEETAAILAKLSDSIADTYAARAGHDRAHWRDLMKAESWYTAEEAVTAGLADQWVDAPAAQASFDLSTLGFAFAGREHAPAPRMSITNLPDSTEPGVPNRKEPVAMSDTLKAGLRERLGVTDANASDETLFAALDEVLDAATTPDAPAAPVVPEGTSLIDSGVLATLQSDAAQGRAAREEQNTARRESIVNQALAEGRIAPAARQTWLDQLEANEEGTRALINSLAAGTIPVSELGHQPADASGDDAEYYALFPDERPAPKGA